MPHTDTTPVSASIASTGKGIRYIGDFCYAYSGLIDADNNETTYLDFTSGSGYIVGKLQWYTDSASTANFELKIYLNNIVIIASESFNLTTNEPLGYAPIEIIIPPTNIFKATLINTQTTDLRSSTISLTGRMYGAE